MSFLSSIILEDYRRFRGEIELPFCPGANLVVVPSGKGKTTLIEAISWCLLGNELVSVPGDVPNVDALGKGMAKVRVRLTFQDSVGLERFAIYSSARDEIVQEGWGWKLIETIGDVVTAEGTDEDRFRDLQERFFPETCVYGNLISGPSLLEISRGRKSGVEMAAESSGMWCCSDLPIRCCTEATSMLLGCCPNGAIRTIGYDAVGHLELSAEGPVPMNELRVAMLCYAIAFAKESSDHPIVLDAPFDGIAVCDRPSVLNEILERFDDRQIIFLMSDKDDMDILRDTGRIGKEIEIWG